ncbi:hypothetical protein PybrP1_012802 [[Pythium] brassicae (nom. inval.)]|nr:hypothetical protein PybrP1_012802 [[Pythium] brassicae (nom. inval.)]
MANARLRQARRRRPAPQNSPLSGAALEDAPPAASPAPIGAETAESEPHALAPATGDGVHEHKRALEERLHALTLGRALPRVSEPQVDATGARMQRAHRDFLLQEMEWMAADFAQERKWRLKSARVLAGSLVSYHSKQATRAARQQKTEEEARRRLAARIGRDVKKFWGKIDKIISFKVKLQADELRKAAMERHLKQLVAQTEKYAAALASTFQGTPTATATAADSSGAGDDEQQEHRRIPDGDGTEPGGAVTPASAASERGGGDTVPAPGRTDTAAADGDDSDYAAPSDDEQDDETTIAADEQLATTAEIDEEVALLAAESELPIDELRARYSGAFDAGDSSAEEDDDEEDEEEEATPFDAGASDAQDADGDADGDADEDFEVGDEEPDDESTIAEAERTLAPTQQEIDAELSALHEESALSVEELLARYAQARDDDDSDDSNHNDSDNDSDNDSRQAAHEPTEAVVGHAEPLEPPPHRVTRASSGFKRPYLLTCLVNWEMEFKRWCPAFKVLTYFGSAKRRKALRQGWSKPNAFQVCITSYQLVVQDAHCFKRKKWYYLVLDEAHHIKNWKSLRWQTLLAGAPPPDTADTGSSSSSSQQQQELVAQLHGIIRPFVLRRLKKDVARQMPGKFEHVVTCQLSRRQRFLYEDFIARSSTRRALFGRTGGAGANVMSLMNVLMQLRKVCNHPDFRCGFLTRAVALDARDLPHWRHDASLPSLELAGCEKRTSQRWRQLFYYDVNAPLPADAAPPTPELAAESAPDVLRRLVQRAHARAQYWQEKRARVATSSRLRVELVPEPVYGSDLVRACTLPVFVSHAMAVHAQRSSVRARDWRERSDVLSVMVRAPEDRVAELAPIVTRAVCFVPRARARPAELRFGSGRFASPAAVARQEFVVSRMRRAEALVRAHAEPLARRCVDVYYEAFKRTQLFFPDKRLVQFDCGKLQQLDNLLRTLKRGGHRCLIFTQMSSMLNILEVFLNIHGHTYFRLDGSTKVEKRQALMDRFNRDEKQKRHLDFLVMAEGQFTTDFFSKANLRELVTGHDGAGDTDAGDTDADADELSLEALESAMAQVEDEEDVVAMKGAKEEFLSEQREFDEDPASGTTTTASSGATRRLSSARSGRTTAGVKPSTPSSVSATSSVSGKDDDDDDDDDNDDDNEAASVDGSIVADEAAASPIGAGDDDDDADDADEGGVNSVEGRSDDDDNDAGDSSAADSDSSSVAAGARQRGRKRRRASATPATRKSRRTTGGGSDGASSSVAVAAQQQRAEQKARAKQLELEEERKLQAWKDSVSSLQCFEDALNAVDRYALHFREQVDPLYAYVPTAAALESYFDSQLSSLDVDRIDAEKAREEAALIADGELIAGAMRADNDTDNNDNNGTVDNDVEAAHRALYRKQRAHVHSERRRRRLTGAAWELKRCAVTNQPFYWNVDTREAVWERPAVLAANEDVARMRQHGFAGLLPSVLLAILQCLSAHPDRHRVELVCRAWRRAATHPSLFVKLSASDLHARGQSLAQALAGVARGETVLVGAGVYALADVVDVATPLRLLAAPDAHVELQMTTGRAQLRWSARGGVLCGFRLTRPSPAADDRDADAGAPTSHWQHLLHVAGGGRVRVLYCDFDGGGRGNACVAVSGSVASRAVLLDSRVYHGGSSGVLLVQGELVMVRNSVFANAHSGVSVLAGHALLRRNTIQRNGRFGIRLLYHAGSVIVEENVVNDHPCGNIDVENSGRRFVVRLNEMAKDEPDDLPHVHGALRLVTAQVVEREVARVAASSASLSAASVGKASAETASGVAGGNAHPAVIARVLPVGVPSERTTTAEDAVSAATSVPPPGAPAPTVSSVEATVELSKATVESSKATAASNTARVLSPASEGGQATVAPLAASEAVGVALPTDVGASVVATGEQRVKQKRKRRPKTEKLLVSGRVIVLQDSCEKRTDKLKKPKLSEPPLSQASDAGSALKAEPQPQPEHSENVAANQLSAAAADGDGRSLKVLLLPTSGERVAWPPATAADAAAAGVTEAGAPATLVVVKKRRGRKPKAALLDEAQAALLLAANVPVAATVTSTVPVASSSRGSSVSTTQAPT